MLEREKAELKEAKSSMEKDHHRQLTRAQELSQKVTSLEAALEASKSATPGRMSHFVLLLCSQMNNIMHI